MKAVFACIDTAVISLLAVAIAYWAIVGLLSSTDSQPAAVMPVAACMSRHGLALPGQRDKLTPQETCIALARAACL
jgi:hypothetical protein